MNTLGKEATHRFFKSENGYADLKAHWSKLVNSPEGKELTAAHHLLYAVLRGKDWRKGLSPITNAKKLANGGLCAWGRSRAYYRVLSTWNEADLLAPFAGHIDADTLKLVREVLPSNFRDTTDAAYKEIVAEKVPANAA